MRFHLRFLRRRHMRPTPSYLLPPVTREVVFHPSLRRAGDVLAEAHKIAS
jgi:hypothetical protein